jgi:hypothetical protein
MTEIIYYLYWFIVGGAVMLAVTVGIIITDDRLLEGLSLFQSEGFRAFLAFIHE